MPQAVAGAAAAIGTFFASTAAVAVLVKTILINVALGALAKALSKKPRTTEPPINVTIRNTVENRRLIFGTRRAGGSFVFYTTSGTDNKYLWYVIVYAGHQCQAIRDVWLGSQRIPNANIGGGAAAGGTVGSGTFANKVVIDKHLGTAFQNANVGLDEASTEWTATHRLKGCAYIVVRMERDDT